MAGTYKKLVVWAFDAKRFSYAIIELLHHFTKGEIAEICGVSPSTINHWAVGHYDVNFPHPSMSNFLRVCDELDLDPTDFFVQEDL